MSGIHSALLHTGKVLLFSYPDSTSTNPGSEARVWDPVTGASEDASVTTGFNIFCAGQSFLPDGRLLLTGGDLLVEGQDKPYTEIGIKETHLFDPASNTWSLGPDMTEPRWYPTNVPLANGDTLVFGGHYTESQPAASVDRYRPGPNPGDPGTITRLPSSAGKVVGLYPRMHLLPNGKIFLSGQQKETLLFDPAKASWSPLGVHKLGPRYAGLSVLLPGLKDVLYIGGDIPGFGVTATTEIISPEHRKAKWRDGPPMNIARARANAVQLPDGNVLVVGGAQDGPYGKPVRTAELYDPKRNSWTVMATQADPRMYHSTATLLPDGRVLSAGSDDGGIEGLRGEIYSPPYLFKGPRPSISSAPASVGYGQKFTITTPDAGNITEVALIKQGSITHEVNFEQRYVDLAFTTASGSLTATSPANGNVAPPGHYLLFVVSSGVPSVASWLRVG